MNKKGFTLLELLVVVLIIGILAAIALPQYKMAVTKAKVASILPLMRRWKDALAEYKLQHGDYDVEDASYLGVNWPSDWTDRSGENSCGDSLRCKNDYWECRANVDTDGRVLCSHENDNWDFNIQMFQQDDAWGEEYFGKTICRGTGKEGNKICKALGGKLIELIGGDEEDCTYSLN